MKAFRPSATIAATVLGLLLAVGIGLAQSNATLDFYGHYLTVDEANRVAGQINDGAAPGWSNAVAERVANSVTGNFGVYARRVAPNQNQPDNPEPKANSDLAVTITWNTTSDVDLWVTEPGGVRCSYQNPSTSNGGKLLEDNTTGFGPELYTIARAPRGEYVIFVNHYRAAGPTTVEVEVTRFAGTPNQTTQRYTVNLQGNGQTAEVCRVRF